MTYEEILREWKELEAKRVLDRYEKLRGQRERND
jgi:hypothetical protein